MLRPGGEVVLVEDSFAVDRQPLADNSLSSAFHLLPLDGMRLLCLALLDASSCLTTNETMPFYFTFRPIDDWIRAVTDAGFVEPDLQYWGFCMFSLYQAPLMILRAHRT
jgi:hypothetical protein